MCGPALQEDGTLCQWVSQIFAYSRRMVRLRNRGFHFRLWRRVCSSGYRLFCLLCLHLIPSALSSPTCPCSSPDSSRGPHPSSALLAYPAPISPQDSHPSLILFVCPVLVSTSRLSVRVSIFLLNAGQCQLPPSRSSSNLSGYQS